MSPAKIAYTIYEAAEACGVSDSIIRRAIAKGDLVPRYPTSKAVLLADDLRDWLESAPTERRSAS